MRYARRRVIFYTKLKPPCSSLDIHFPASVARGRGSKSCQPRPAVIHTHASYVAMKMTLGARYEEGRPFYSVTMEFIIILMMLQLRQVSVGWQLRGRFHLFFYVHTVYAIMIAGDFAGLLAHTCSDNQAAVVAVGGNGGKVGSCSSLPWECVALLQLIINDHSGGH